MEALLSAGVLFAAALCQGFFGFGFGILAMSGLTAIHDLIHAAGVVNLSALLLTGSHALHLRRAILWPVVGRILPGILVGVVLGVAALGAFEGELMVRLLGATIVAIAVWNLAAPSLRTRDSALWDAGAGLLAGLLGGAFNTGGPPLVAHLYRRADAPEALRATIQTAFLTIGLARLPVAASQGLMARAVWWDALASAPVVLAALFAGAVLARRLGAERFRRWSWVAFGLLGLVMLSTS